MQITHDSITHSDGVSHKWTADGFAYIWHEDADARRGSLLMVGGVDRVQAGPKGWVVRPQRVYVPTWGGNGPLIYGATSSDPQTAWHGADEVLAVVRDLIAEGFTRQAGLFQFESARFLGSADGQYVMTQGGWEIPNDGDRVATIDPHASGRSGFLPGEQDEPLPALSDVSAESLADEIRKAIQ